MSYDNLRTEYTKEHIYIVEIDLDYCTLTSGVGPCTATETGDDKCFNTFSNTNDAANFDKGIKTYRFCESRSPHPIGMSALDIIPSIKSVSVAASKIDIKGGLGVRASVNISFSDHPHSDIGIDKYVDERTWIASDRGTFWTKLRARNPNYQNRPLRVLSGYLANGEYDPVNFTTRYYIIDKMNVSGGQATITAKDPLKLANNKKAQAPAPSTGTLTSDLVIAGTSATLTPSGVGNLEYDTSGWVSIGKEICSFTRVADTLTLVRAQKNTLDEGHSSGDTVQQCLEYAGVTRGQLDFIVNDLITNFANIDTAFVPLAAWDAEVGTHLSGLLSGFIAKPFDVNKLLVELAESMPHYLWWDERSATIQLTALKAPATNANVLGEANALIEDSVKTTDATNMRASTVFVNFGQVNPIKKLDDPENYLQTYIRVDVNSISKYGSNEIKVINSRWISDTNKAAALQLGALYGRRFADIPRKINFSLDSKDSSLWIGQNACTNHRDIVDATGAPIDLLFQVISSKESKNFDYEGLEYTYGDALPEDEGGGDPDTDLVIFGSNQLNINLRTAFDGPNGLYPTPDATTKAKFVVEAGVVMGGSVLGSPSIVTGEWPAGATVTIQNSGFIVGRGGQGGNGLIPPSTGDSQAGSDAIEMNFDLEIINLNIIGGGGGGGGEGDIASKGAGGGGGAGGNVGFGGYNYNVTGSAGSGGRGHASQRGTTELGGLGGLGPPRGMGNPGLVEGGAGGDLGQSGANGISGDTVGSGSAAGNAITTNGFTLTQTTPGDIRGSIV